MSLIDSILPLKRYIQNVSRQYDLSVIGVHSSALSPSLLDKWNKHLPHDLTHSYSIV
ncbi:Membrane-associated serine protease [Lactococcus lactis subsp. lactis NCDO 2118]|uniref:Membrane-associated serine protease n=1 Tax=Lactococcus lactis subsp. lactis NCDO 2118 TaxID=1117941 RepID=A0ABC8A3D8_LACLL|nr:Membrane-associated serine protease [Lactococcus lactis subsp. lactis NCDO 2118]